MKLGILFASFFLSWSTCAFATTNLILIGGGKRPSEAMRTFVTAAGGNHARIVIIPWASGSTQSAETIRAELAPFHPEAIEVMPQYFAKKTNFFRYSKIITNLLDSASGIFFTGGDQNKLMKAMNDLELKSKFKNLYLNGVAFAGTSAGTAIMSKRMLTGVANTQVIDGKQVQLSEGLGLLPEEIIVDQHFIVRQRFNRLASLILTQEDAYGIAIDENTALHITNQRMARVIGPTQVMLFTKTSDQSLSVEFHSHGEFFNLFGLKTKDLN